MQNKSRLLSRLDQNKMSSPRVSVGDLPLSYAYKEDSRQQISGMTTSFMGFTLIELLVVVLIIGILAAVALPQYTLAVNKTRFSNLRSMATPFIQAANAYYLANNSWPDNFEELALDMPAGFEITTVPNGNSHFSCGQNNETFCCIAPQGTSAQPIINCMQKDKSFAYSFFLSSRENYCIANKENANAKKLCRALSKRNGVEVWGWYTPDGYIQETRYYLIDN